MNERHSAIEDYEVVVNSRVHQLRHVLEAREEDLLALRGVDVMR